MYSAYDLQCNCYFHTGRNSKTKEECIMDIVEWLIEGEEVDNNVSNEEILNMFEVEIHEHEEPIKEV